MREIHASVDERDTCIGTLRVFIMTESQLDLCTSTDSLLVEAIVS